ncbi:MAG: hypothetical protein WD708_01955 [Kiritimatiellia bacterium]
MKNLFLIPLLLTILLCAGCDGGGLSVDTSPIGVGLAAIAAAMILSAFAGGGK